MALTNQGTRNSILRALFAILVVQACYWLLFDPIFHRTKPPQSIVDIKAVEWAKLAGPDEQSWQLARFEKKELPYDECCEHGYRGVKASFDLPAVPQRPLGIIMRMSSDNFILKINGSTIFQEGRVDIANGTYHGNVRKVFLIPQAVVRAGRNELQVMLAHDEGIPYFDFVPPIIGDYQTLSDSRRGENFTLNQLATANLAIGLLVTVLTGIIILRGGNTPVLRWFLVIVGSWTAQLLYFEMTEPPLHGIARLFWLYLFNTLLPLGWLNLANHWSNRPLRFVEPASIGGWLVLSLFNAAVLWLGLLEKIDTVDLVSMWWGLSVSVGAVVLLLRAVVRNFDQQHWETALFTLCLMLIGIDAVSAIFDLSIKKYADNAMVFLIVGLVAAFLVRNVRLFQSSASLNALLQNQLGERTAELEAAHSREKVMVRESAHQAERQRIMRDMHDGLGSQLMSMLLMARRGQADPPVVAEGLQTVIDEMRLMIDSMDSVGESLQSALTIFRERVEPRVAAAGKRLVWDDRSGGNLPDLGPREVLQVFRVLQEAVTNALKHSTGDTVTISLERPGPEGLRLVVADNGSGMGAANPRGRGMINMEGRAEAVGGALTVESSDSGVQIVLELPDKRIAKAAP